MEEHLQQQLFDFVTKVGDDDWGVSHADHVAVLVSVPQNDMSSEDLLRTIAQALPGWQATAFPSHMILYKESRRYTYGDVIWPV